MPAILVERAQAHLPENAAYNRGESTSFLPKVGQLKFDRSTTTTIGIECPGEWQRGHITSLFVSIFIIVQEFFAWTGQLSLNVSDLR